MLNILWYTHKNRDVSATMFKVKIMTIIYKDIKVHPIYTAVSQQISLQCTLCVFSRFK